MKQDENQKRDTNQKIEKTKFFVKHYASNLDRYLSH